MKDFPLHNSHFDYNDDVLEMGARIFMQLIRERLPIVHKWKLSNE